MTRIRLAACQINTVVGDLDGNVQRIVDALDIVNEIGGCDIAVFPELTITGYPPEDLLLKPGFIADNRAALDKVAARTGICAAIVGFVDRDQDLHNAAAVCANGQVVGVTHKRLLPNYSVFDEKRYFTPGAGDPLLYDIAGVTVGVSICEDAWSPTGPIATQAAGGAELIININASPFYAARAHERERMLATRAEDASCTLVYVNQVGGQDELVFDGGTLVFDADGELIGRGEQFTENIMTIDLDVRPVFRKRLLDPRGRKATPRLERIHVTDAPTSRPAPVPPAISPIPDRHREIYDALVLGTRDYVRKNGFSEVVIGLSGGIDSAMVAMLATDALGAENVHGVSMPSRFSSGHSKDDAATLAENLEIDYRSIAIEEAHNSMLSMLAPSFAGQDEGLAEENLQARIRGMLLMALSNKFGWMVLTTGNKSELAVGYSTLYGDMAGGYAVIKDVPKTLVYELAEARNEWAGRDLIPRSSITKPPSAELRPDQRDDQSLPPYDVLDAVLEAYVEQDLTASEIIASGHDAEMVKEIVRLVDRAEYKRRQSPPGPRVTSKAFGKDRRLPITNRYRG